MATYRNTFCSKIKLLCAAVSVMLGQSIAALTSAEFGAGEGKTVRSLRSVSESTAVPPQVREVRLHPGVVASVVIVTLAALVAAVFIIRKYCFPQSDATYRYSVLRQMEEHSGAPREDDSDEDLLE